MIFFIFSYKFLNPSLWSHPISGFGEALVIQQPKVQEEPNSSNSSPNRHSSLPSAVIHHNICVSSGQSHSICRRPIAPCRWWWIRAGPTATAGAEVWARRGAIGWITVGIRSRRWSGIIATAGRGRAGAIASRIGAWWRARAARGAEVLRRARDRLTVVVLVGQTGRVIATARGGTTASIAWGVARLVCAVRSVAAATARGTWAGGIVRRETRCVQATFWSTAWVCGAVVVTFAGQRCAGRWGRTAAVGSAHGTGRVRYGVCVGIVNSSYNNLWNRKRPGRSRSRRGKDAGKRRQRGKGTEVWWTLVVLSFFYWNYNIISWFTINNKGKQFHFLELLKKILGEIRENGKSLVFKEIWKLINMKKKVNWGFKLIWVGVGEELLEGKI